MNQIFAIPAFDDNYIWCLHDGKYAIVVDPGQAKPVEEALISADLTLTAILITHHHYDHVGGVLALKEKHNDVPVYGPKNPNIKGLTHNLSEGDIVSIESPSVTLNVLELHGHTMDHIGYVNEDLVFCGDTLFSAGCGRMFEGTPEIFYKSLSKLAALPENTKVYCTHEYTLANLAFAKHVDPENMALQEYSRWAEETRALGKITLPSDIKTQKRINPFLRCEDKRIEENIAKEMNLSPANAVEVFAALRSRKDSY
ncbi:hydroxyacylglutathione hydrolase [Brumicola blandensis]|jgi:hydroxyacylglutathione hydrolase|uniref:Hydroxyacylglutathione hydrolase n=1 Tax=Brumicola blandensis TaxID=3075611 RepID=A0AAW8QYV1_9ALTE|nr:hydroxyacylglutathione hydrolase [Alteromonas sp. W409]MDT0581166.1 hydroxyacylglutathione hydrolase [Alteromonas sp. W409]